MRSGGSRAGPDVPVERNYRRIFADGRDGCSDRVQGAFRQRKSLCTRFITGIPTRGMRWPAQQRLRVCRFLTTSRCSNALPVIAKIHAERLGQLREYAVVGDTRQIGTMGAIELRTDDAGYLSSDAAEALPVFSRAWSAAAAAGECGVRSAAVCDLARRVALSVRCDWGSSGDGVLGWTVVARVGAWHVVPLTKFAEGISERAS